MGTGVSGSVGFAGTVSEAEWATAQRPTNNGYVEGCAVTPGAGAREVTIASGRVWVAGTYHTVAGATLALAENTSGQPRVDVVALYVNWSADDAALVAVQGTPAASPAVPTGSLTATAGAAWHVPVAHVTVASGAGVLAASTIRDVRPGPWIEFTLESPWSDYGGEWERPAYRMTPAGDVELRGSAATSSTITSPRAQRFVNMPAGWRPARSEIFVVACNTPAEGVAEFGRVDVGSGGDVRVANPPNTTGYRWYSLSGVRFTPGT